MTAATLKIAFVGAGQVNFGGGEGPWNHVKRLEHMVIADNYALECVGICDPMLHVAESVLEVRRSNPDVRLKKMWESTRLFTNLVDMLDATTPHCVFIGVPPAYHGCTQKPYNIEIECATRGVHMFVEKPISCHQISEVDAVNDFVQAAVKNNGLVVSVGYMFRYSRAVLRMKEIIERYGPIKAFNARYLCAYTPIDKPVWWDVDRSGGPIVEQGTHFCDLARFLGGDVDLDTLQAMSIKQTDKAGKLDHIPERINEEALAPEKRVPRVTTAFWKFKNGAIGSFMHGVLMHELKYETELEVWGDGYRLQLIDPYGKCQLGVRLPHSEETVIEDFGIDDPYYSEDLSFMRAVKHAVENNDSSNSTNDSNNTRNPHTSGILSSYEDSVGTYKLTWAIRTKSEQNSA